MENQKTQTYDHQRAYSYTVKLLTGRDYSEKKLREKLVLKKYPKNVIEDVIGEIKERGFLREESYVEARIKAFMNKGYSKRYILQKISQEAEQINLESIDEIFLEYRISEEDQVLKLALKKCPTNIPKDFEEKKKIFQKIVRFIISKGHKPGLAFNAAKNALSAKDREFSAMSDFAQE